MDLQLYSMLIIRLILALSVLLITEASFRSSLAGLASNMRPKTLRLFSSSTLTPPSESASILKFLDIVEQLKIKKRTGWHICGIDYNNSESIADHMYRMGIMAMTIHDPAIDKLKAIKMAMVHDLAEAIVGDITPSCGVSEEEKMRLETEAMAEIRKTLAGNPFGEEAEALWKEYTEDQTVVAQFVKDLDKTELIVQVVAYENRYKIGFNSWIKRARAKIRHPVLQAIADDALKTRPKPEEFTKMN